LFCWEPRNQFAFNLENGGENVRKIPLISIFIIALVAFAIWAPNASAQVAAEVEAPGAVNAAAQGRTPVGIQFVGLEQVEIAELVCGGDVSNAGATPERINADDDEFTALFRTLDLMLVCEDTAIVCTGTLADGTPFMGEDEIRVIRDLEGNRCPR
jgi:hypothetical protein